VRQRSTDVLVRFSGIDTREKAQALAGFELWVEREHAAPLAEGEFYAADLCKCSLYYGEQLIGTVRSVVDAGPNQLLEVARAEGKTLLVPFIDHFIAEVDVEGGRISLREDYIVR
jgi:16S rRNA processing protein RimM